MHIFYRPMYQSEASTFINGLKAKDPQMAARQVEGRALLWDKKIDRDAASEYRAAKVTQNAYVYQTASK